MVRGTLEPRRLSAIAYDSKHVRYRQSPPNQVSCGPMPTRRQPQLPLALRETPAWGGRRARSGRKPTGARAMLSHNTRPPLASRNPAHVTLKVRSDVRSLRSRGFVAEFMRTMAQTCDRGDFRVVHYSLQTNHVHFLVEADGRHALARGMIAVGARLARAVNRTFGRRGPVLADRYHLRALKTPREARNALRYVLLNASRHASRRIARLDPASSARWFDGWRTEGASTLEHSRWRPPPVAEARSWLLRLGWRIHGLLDPADVPGRHRERTRRKLPADSWS